jgi:hypothetical protein
MKVGFTPVLMSRKRQVGLNGARDELNSIGSNLRARRSKTVTPVVRPVVELAEPTEPTGGPAGSIDRPAKPVVTPPKWKGAGR